MKIFKPLTSILILSLFSACYEKTEEKKHIEELEKHIRLGPENNPERLEKKITAIPENYIPIPQGNYGIIWENPFSEFFGNNRLPYHAYKFINDAGGVINFEKDYFFSGKEYYQADADGIGEYSTESVRMTVTYTYTTHEKRIPGWECILEDSNFPREKFLT